MTEMGELLAEMRALREAVEQGRSRPLVLTVAAVALELSLSMKTVKRMIARGDLVGLRAKTRLVLVTAAEVDRWIRDNSTPPDTRQKKRPKSEADKIRALAKT